MREKVEKVFRKVKGEFKAVGVTLKENNSIDTAAYDYKSKTIVYNPNFVQRNEEYLEDIFRHEFGHHKWLANSLENRLWQEIILSPYAKDIQEINETINLFNDIGVNYRLVRNFGEKTKINEIYKNSPDFEGFRKSELGGTLLKLLETLTGRDWGSENYVQEALDELLEIPWEYRGWTLGIDYGYFVAKRDLIDFYYAIKDLLEKEKNKLPQRYRYSPQVSEKEARRIVRKLLRKGLVGSKEVSSWYQKRFPEKVKEIEKKLYKQTGILPGDTAGTRVFPTLDIVLQYLFEIEKYDVKVEPFMLGKQTEEVTETKPWDLGEPFKDIRWSSYRGFIIPNVTPMKNVRKETSWGLEHRLEYPNLLIILDDSGSRVNQYGAGFHEKVIPDVTVSGVVAKKYLLEGAKVGVVKFSGTTQYFGYFRDLETVIYTLASFEGGETFLDTDIVKKAVQEGRKGNILPDVLLVTDGEIDNAKEIVELFNKYAGRVWVFFMDPELKNNKDYYSIWQRLKKGKVYFIKRPEEIMRIVLK